MAPSGATNQDPVENRYWPAKATYAQIFELEVPTPIGYPHRRALRCPEIEPDNRGVFPGVLHFDPYTGAKLQWADRE